MKINENLIEDYLDGKIVNDNTLKDLYDNFEFMKLLLFRTRDSKYYNLCSNRLKTNIDFVLYLTNIFDNNLDLLFSMINFYVYSVGESEERFSELLYKIDKYIKKWNKDFDITYYMQYRCKIIWFFDMKQDYINLILSTQDKSFQREYSFGFPIVQILYKDSENTQLFFSEHYLDKILYTYDFEEYIHMKYKTLEELNTYGNITVLANYAKTFDLALYEFVLVHPEVLKDREVRLLEIKDNYNNFVLNDTKNKIYIFNNKLIEYLEEQNMNLDTKTNIIKLEEIKRLGLENEFFGREIELPTDIKDESAVNFEDEKLRLFMRTELYNLFKSKKRKIELTINNEEDE